MRLVLETGCLGLGILCLLYYIGIISYAGITTSFAWIWLLGGFVLILLRFALHWQFLHPDSRLRFVTGTVFVYLAICLAVVLLTGKDVVAAMHDGTDVPQNLDYVIVLGAQVRGSSPSRALRKRLDRAADYAEENPKTTFILSGGQGADEDISEAECMYQYLIEAGVSGDRLIKEEKSTSTRENLQFSSALIHTLEETSDLSSDVDASVGILSNDFHIYRALLLAEKLGYTDAVGISAPSDIGMLPHNVLREICAVLVTRLL
ncbi:MAG: YdcF family protein [Lachnospiraceae bacterium]|nr:YdcF family protein [Lachnospiraceae bacterium]